jgi:uncharacterized protein VirK/YbjX
MLSAAYFSSKSRLRNFLRLTISQGVEVETLQQPSGTIERLTSNCWLALLELRGFILFLKAICARLIYMTGQLIGQALDEKTFVFAFKSQGFVLKESITATIIGHFEIVRIMNHRATLPLTKRYPSLATKYFGSYLAKSFSKTSRREILKFHYQYLTRHVCESFHKQILESGAVLWDEMIDENRYMISLSFNSEWHREGDLSLVLTENNISLYEISFTVVPGDLIDDHPGQILLIARVQGARQQVEAIRRATRACHDIAPPHLLMAAAQSVAGAMQINTIGGVGNREHVSRIESEARGFFFDYDVFWETFAVKKRGADIYTISVPFPQKPFEDIKIDHRRRTRRKRQFKDRIAGSVGAAFSKKFLTADQAKE